MSDHVANLLERAWSLREVEQWDEMLALAREARSAAEQAGFTRGVARSLAVSAFARYVRSDIRTALGECMDALRLAPRDPGTESGARRVLALIHWSLGNYDEALHNADRSIRAADSAGLEAAFTFAIKGGILLSLGALDEAVEYHMRSLDEFKARGSRGVEMARALAGLGLVYLAQRDHEHALSALTEAVDIARQLGNRATIARVLNDLGEAFEAIGNDDEALRHHSEALGIRQQDGYRPAETTSLLALARIRERRGDHARAIGLGQRALVIATELGLKPRIAQSHDLLATAYEQTADLQSALCHLRQCDKAKSELAVEQSAMRYNAAVHEAEMEAVQRHAELESLATLGSLVAAVSHEINSPLGAIRSSADIAARAAQKLSETHDEKYADVLRTNTCVIGEGTGRIAEVIRRLKLFAGIDQSDFTPIDLVAAIKDVVELLRPEFGPQVDVAVDYSVKPFINAYATELRHVFLVLLRNARQSIVGTGKVSVEISGDEAWIRVAFTDSGTGIPADVLPHLFSPSFRARDNRVRASLSLFTCMAVVKKHGGTLEVQSLLGEGATFTLALPRTLERAQSEPHLRADLETSRS